ncbi:phosphate signaling complex protein PhoU [Parenemella sanctibonifatiensis]|uniref:Phosphate-specific transport system accessory protein PhoU n=1 Tax=Parenemella sanctibonifatiensis TaxID=2016505 RepID=A0A255DZM0_9ACTN|nr:phosphate signaling complex protein PhoU [Parenemella sanctibonifatiensis]OYN84696.1 phosphate transport system regulatory protein PhoU [Parenemella sanctibonifatiensis]
MRDSYHDRLDLLMADLLEMTDRVRTAVQDATRALTEADVQLAESVISGDQAIDALASEVEQTGFSVLAISSPVAGDLRMVTSGLRVVMALERMGDLAAHIAKIARLRYPDPAVPPRMMDSFLRMAEVAEAMVATAGRTLQDRDADTAAQLAANDEQMDKLRRDQFVEILGDDWDEGVAAAVDVALLGRYYERIADHAVSVGKRVVFLVTGIQPSEQN